MFLGGAVARRQIVVNPRRSCVSNTVDGCLPDTAFLKFPAEPLQRRIGLLRCVRLEGAFQLGEFLPFLVRLQTSRRGSHAA